MEENVETPFFESHWGELPSVELLGTVVDDEDDEATPRSDSAMNKTKDPAFFFTNANVSKEEDRQRDSWLDLPSYEVHFNENVMHTIDLVHHARRLQSMIDDNQQKWLSKQKSNIVDDDDVDTSLKIPEMRKCDHCLTEDVVSARKTPFRPALGFRSDEEEGSACPPPLISRLTAHKLLNRSASILTAHVGYEVCDSIVLDMLTDLLGSYLGEFTKAMRFFADSDSGHTFPRLIDRVLAEESHTTRDLMEFYQERVIRYHDNQVNLCKNLTTELEMDLRNQKSRSRQRLSSKKDISSPAHTSLVGTSSARGQMERSDLLFMDSSHGTGGTGQPIKAESMDFLEG